MKYFWEAGTTYVKIMILKARPAAESPVWHTKGGVHVVHVLVFG